MSSIATADAPHPIPLTPSEVLIRGFLAANPSLDAELGPIELMTDRYTNDEWVAQIAETQAAVLREVESGERGVKVYAGPQMQDGGEALKQLARTVDHTVLKLDATSSQIDTLCSEARTEEFKSVCVRLNWVSRCVSNLKGSPVVVAAVVGFHEGTQDTLSKLREARACVAAGASELDLVLNYSLLTACNPPATSSSGDSAIDGITAANTAANAGTQRTPDYSAIYRELASIRSLCPGVVIKLILETSQLTPHQILAASHLAAAANLDFIKTSTGFNGPGASLPNVQLMVAAAEYLVAKGVSTKKMEVKASGGVRSLEDAVKMLESGATRLGTSSGLWIMQQAREKVGEGKEGVERPGATRLYTDDSVAGGY